MQVGEGANPEGAGGEEEKPGTGDDSATVEVTAPKEPDSPSPADIAEGDESPLEAATNASASGEAQVISLSESKRCSLSMPSEIPMPAHALL